MTQAPSQLLEKYCQALSRTKKHHGIYFRHVKALVQHIYRKEEGYLSYLEISQERRALLVAHTGDKRRRRNPMRGEHLCHVTGMDDCDTKSNSLHHRQVWLIAVDSRKDGVKALSRQGMRTGI